MDSSIDTLFLLIKGEIQALPVQVRIKDWLLLNIGLTDNDFANGNGSDSLNRLALILERIRKHTADSMYVPLLNDLNKLRQQITCYIENHSRTLQDAEESLTSLSSTEVIMPQDESDYTNLRMTEPVETETLTGEKQELTQTDFAVKNYGAYSTSSVVELLQESTKDKKSVIQREWSRFPNPDNIEDGHLPENVLEPIQLKLE